MPPKRQPVIWSAEAHTIAKIAILGRYLGAWFSIMGLRSARQDILYVDGFAGPGKYLNHADGSPVIALRAASQVRASRHDWIAGTIHCAFIESDPRRFEHLQQHLLTFQTHDGIKKHLQNATFERGLARLRDEMPTFFDRDWPLFVFIDPFGATGNPFSLVSDILRSPKSEVLINFDADAVARILRAGKSANSEMILTAIYGDESWREIELDADSFGDQYRRAVSIYENRLRSLPNVKYVFSFQMGHTAGALDYYLVFASQHKMGLVKMKEAMQALDQTGEYQFFDAHVGQHRLFRFNHPDDFAPKLYQRFQGRRVTYKETEEYALTDTPFVNPKKMLAILEDQGLLDVESTNPKRRRGTFNEETIVSLSFRTGDTHG